LIKIGSVGAAAPVHVDAVRSATAIECADRRGESE
jgi:hypothetical protein